MWSTDTFLPRKNTWKVVSIIISSVVTLSLQALYLTSLHPEDTLSYRLESSFSKPDHVATQLKTHHPYSKIQVHLQDPQSPT